jgi:hypothetical protein
MMRAKLHVPWMGLTRAAPTVFALIFVTAFAAFVWPTLYRPIVVLPSPTDRAGTVAARQNRFTGEVQWLPAVSDRWARGFNPATPSAADTSDPGLELRRLADSVVQATLNEKRRRVAGWSAAALAVAVGLGFAAFSIIRVRRSRFHAI